MSEWGRYPHICRSIDVVPFFAQISRKVGISLSFYCSTFLSACVRSLRLKTDFALTEKDAFGPLSFSLPQPAQLLFMAYSPEGDALAIRESLVRCHNATACRTFEQSRFLDIRTARGRLSEAYEYAWQSTLDATELLRTKVLKRPEFQVRGAP